MIINSTTTEVTFVPFIDFTEIYDVNISVWHKETKVKVTEQKAVSKTDSYVTIELPTLTTITAQAQEGDDILIRIENLSGNLLWEYLGTWLSGSSDLYREFKTYTKPDDNSIQWMKTN